METRLHLDTHAVVWLHQGDLRRFSSQAKERLEDCALLYAPVVQLELTFLFEIGRLRVPSHQILADLQGEIGLESCVHGYADVVQFGCGESWTRDPFDRLIVAQARMDNAPLLSKDQKIQDHYPLAFW